MNIKVVAVQQRIDLLQAKAASESVTSDAELQAQLARFLCVLSSGLIEQAVRSILDDYTSRRSHPTVARYVSNGLSKINNAKFEDILMVLGRFEPDWRKHFEDNTDDDIKAAIDSIVNNRNQIAHGGQVGISLGTFTSYYRNLKRFIQQLELFISKQ